MRKSFQTGFRPCWQPPIGAPKIADDARKPLGVSAARQEAIQGFLDAAERLLIRDGYAKISTRSLAEEARANHGLVHYYFGSMEELFMQVLERFQDRVLERQRAMYGGSGPFIEKWRNAMNYIDKDIATGFIKILFELAAMALNKPEFQERVRKLHEDRHALLREAISQAMKDYGIDRRRFPVEAVTTLVQTFNLGIMQQRAIGYQEGHDALLRGIDRILEHLEAEKQR